MFMSIIDGDTKNKTAEQEYVDQIINLIKQGIDLLEDQIQLVREEINTYTLDELERVYTNFKRCGVKNSLDIYYFCCALHMLK